MAGLGAVCWGIQNYLGAVVTRELSPVQGVLCMQLLGLCMLSPFALGVEEVQGVSISWGALAGVAGVFGWVLMYGASRVGQIAVTQKISSGSAALLPFAVGVAAGFDVTASVLVGFGVLVTSLVLLGSVPMKQDGTGPLYQQRQAVALALGSGLGFGGALIALGHTAPVDGVVPFLAYRIVAAALLIAVAWRRKALSLPPKQLRGRLVGAALFSSLGDVAVLWALQHGSYSLVPAVASLYPGVTALLASWFRKESLGKLQVAGIAGGLIGLVLLHG